METAEVIYSSESWIKADPKNIGGVRIRFIEFLLSLGLDDQEKEGWKLTFSEALNNAIEHGSGGNHEKDVGIRWWTQGNSVWFETEDSGNGPPPEKTKNPQLPEDPLAEGGRGLYIIHQFADHFEHWRHESKYIARIGKDYPRLNNVMPPSSEMDAILEELADCYESLSLYDRMTETLISDERVDRFIASSLEMFMDSRDYDGINIEIRDTERASEYIWVTELPEHIVFGKLATETWTVLEEHESLSWSSKSGQQPFSEKTFSSGGAVPIYVNNEVVGLIATAYQEEKNIFRSNDLRNLRALADIIGTSLSRAVMQRERDEKKRLATEFSIATKLQHRLLPINQRPPMIEGYDLLIESKSALEIAGDFVEVQRDRTGAYIGCVIDVMGKGVSAAILAGIFRSQFLAYCERGGVLSTFLEDVNNALERQLGDATMFITIFAFRLNHITQDLDYVAAGHPPALLLRKSGETEMLESDGPPIGLFKGVSYSERQITMHPGDRLVVVTDGLYEWSHSPRQIFGWDRMVEWFERGRSDSPSEIWEKIQTLIATSRRELGIAQEDDETALILTRK